MIENFFNINPAVLHKTVSSDLLFPVYSLAYESVKANPLIRDEKAVEIKEILDHLSRPDGIWKDDMNHYRLILMKLCFDSLIKDYIWRHPMGTIVNIGCGLDTTFERLRTETVRWYDLDIPEIIGFRKLFIDETEKRRFISASFLSNDWYEKIRIDDSLLLFASGVFYFCNENTIKCFFSKLSAGFPTFELLFDVTSPAGLLLSNRKIRKSAKTKGPFLKWGLDDYRTITDWNPRIKFLGRYGLFHHQVFRIPLRYSIPGLISDAFSMQYILHLKLRYDYRRL